MGLSRAEQEVVINFNLDEDTASIYTAYPKWINKLDKFTEENPEEFKCTAVNKIDGKVVSKEYTFPKKLITIRQKSYSADFQRNTTGLFGVLNAKEDQADNLPPEAERGD
jgi:hypothetical protein